MIQDDLIKCIESHRIFVFAGIPQVLEKHHSVQSPFLVSLMRRHRKLNLTYIHHLAYGNIGLVLSFGLKSSMEPIMRTWIH